MHVLRGEFSARRSRSGDSFSPRLGLFFGVRFYKPQLRSSARELPGILFPVSFTAHLFRV